MKELARHNCGLVDLDCVNCAATMQLQKWGGEVGGQKQLLCLKHSAGWRVRRDGRRPRLVERLFNGLLRGKESFLKKAEGALPESGGVASRPDQEAPEQASLSWRPR